MLHQACVHYALYSSRSYLYRVRTHRSGSSGRWLRQFIHNGIPKNHVHNGKDNSTMHARMYIQVQFTDRGMPILHVVTLKDMPIAYQILDVYTFRETLLKHFAEVLVNRENDLGNNATYIYPYIVQHIQCCPPDR